MSSDQGLIALHVSKIRALGVFAEDGDNVEDRVREAVDTALEHFERVVAVDKADCIQAFRVELNSHASVIGKANPKYRQTLEYAVSLLPGQ